MVVDICRKLPHTRANKYVEYVDERISPSIRYRLRNNPTGEANEKIIK
jgi:hypothetical protein